MQELVEVVLGGQLGLELREFVAELKADELEIGFGGPGEREGSLVTVPEFLDGLTESREGRNGRGGTRCHT